MFIQRARPAAPIAAAAVLPVETGGHPSVNDGPVRFVLETPKHDLRATAVLSDGEFIVEAGSLARDMWRGLNGQTGSYAPLHAELVRSGVLTAQGDRCVFTRNYAFNSPSAAAAVINGRSTSGPAAWRLEGQDLSYRDWEARQLAR
jgi:hypothetical protein